MRIKNVVIYFLLSIILCSCSVTKRRYLNGYYFSHKHRVVQVKEDNTIKDKMHFVHALPTESNFEAKKPAEDALSVQPDKKTNNNFIKIKAAELRTAFEKITPKLKPAVSAEKTDPEKSTAEKPLSLFWIVIVLVLILYLAVIIFAADSLLPLGHVIGIIFAGLLLLWLLRVF